MVLESYSDTFSLIGSCATIPLLLSPTLICREFIKKGSSDHLKATIFVGGLVRAILFLQFGFTFKITALIYLHGFGTFMYSIYAILYYLYYTKKENLHNVIAGAVTFVAIILGFVNLKQESLIANYFGAIVTAVHLGLLGAPLLNLKNIIKTKSTAGLPLPIILCAFIVSLSWLLFGISTHNDLIIFQMVVGVLLTGIQLTLIMLYPAKPSPPPKKKKKQK